MLQCLCARTGYSSGSLQMSPLHFVSKEGWDPTSAALPTLYKLPPPAVTNARFSKCLKFSLRNKGILKAFPNYIESFVIFRYFHFPLFPFDFVT